jgi:hypothetical protein
MASWQAENVFTGGSPTESEKYSMNSFFSGSSFTRFINSLELAMSASIVVGDGICREKSALHDSLVLS